ncbi:MAG: RES family NAD+ phosphorylase [Sediminibacterium sp.]|jgi:RES domain-containing protein|nr:RES family NAD+ phosphorylase [Chitinophagaceae bacterium]MCA6447415.1 RES family NAD+ phosphorylase [Chitinophagaceae bacterium]
MELFRIVREEYARNLSSSGTANRWNLKGQFVLYTSATRSLSSLELIVHRGAIQNKFRYKVMVISIADEDQLIKQIKINKLSANWRTLAAYAELQAIGAHWYTHQESLVLKVPSVIIPQEFNYIINKEHPAFSGKVKLIRKEDFYWDTRLF